MPRKTINQIEVASQRVLMRVDFNVPMDDSGAITDDRRIKLALPSIRSVIERGGRLVLMSHRGRPKGNGYESALSLKPASDRLGQMLEGVRVIFPGEDCIGDDARKSVEALGDGEILMLENLRFHAAEKAGDENFATRLASFGDIYCNEAFGTAHRSDASMVAVPLAMEGKPRVAGLLLQKELEYLGEAVEHPQRPFVAILGGAKVSDKIGAIHNLIGKVDAILVGGAMAYTLLQANGHDLGSSLVEIDKIDEAWRIIQEARDSSTKLLLPLDHVCGKEL
ncbi:MAG: phosphoglycerate kinase, partial [Planctomycetes bacterium]|nr:phosphoglycerate kinase [Planctomycetota bacterium]